MISLLLVEDDAHIVLALGIRLKAAGYAVNTATNAVEAMNQACLLAPDIMVLDINLPGGDGFTVAERFRSQCTLAMTPIIFITASKTPGLEEKAMNLGAVAFLEKPFNSVQLMDAIESAIDCGATNLNSE